MNPAPLLLVWWIGFLVTGFLGRVDVVAAILAVLVVRAITRRMEARAAAGGRGSVPGPWITPQTT